MVNPQTGYRGRGEPEGPRFRVNLRFRTSASGLIIAQKVAAVAPHVEPEALMRYEASISEATWREGGTVPAFLRIATSNVVRDVEVRPLNPKSPGFVAVDDYNGIRVQSYVSDTEPSRFRQRRSSETSREERAVRQAAVAQVALFLTTECQELGVKLSYEGDDDEPGENSPTSD